MEWYVYALLAPAFWALNNVFVKFLITNKFKNYVPMISSIIMMDLPYATIILLILPITINFPYALLALIVGLFPIVAFWFYSKALLLEEVSRLITLFQLIPAFVTVLSAIFLNEILDLQKYLGIIIIVLASILISFRSIKGKSSFSNALKYMIPFSLIIAIYSIMEKYLLNYFDFWSLFFWNIIGASMGILILLSFRKPRKHFTQTLPTVGAKGMFITFIGEGIYVIGTVFSLIAFSLAEASVVSALLGLQPFYLFFYTILVSMFLPKILKEELTKRVITLKLIAITLMLIGTYLIV